MDSSKLWILTEQGFECMFSRHLDQGSDSSCDSWRHRLINSMSFLPYHWWSMTMTQSAMKRGWDLKLEFLSVLLFFLLQKYIGKCYFFWESSGHPSTHASICPSTPSVHLFVYPSVCSPVHPSIHPSNKCVHRTYYVPGTVGIHWWIKQAVFALMELPAYREYWPVRHKCKIITLESAPKERFMVRKDSKISMAVRKFFEGLLELRVKG